jgi:hypothetical protein
MPTPHEALSVTDGDTAREFLISRVIYPLDAAEDPEDFVAQDSTSGPVPKGLAWNETIFWLDPDDTTTAHDGITTLVTLDGYRYKANELDLRIVSVLDRDISDPPDSGTVYGDAYLVPAGATGDWSAHDDAIAIYTARGWQFREPKIGMWLYVEDEDLYLRYDADGTWTEGPGSPSDAPNSIPLSAIINAGRFVIVENQTTNAPPSAAQGVAYIIGSSPTGAWSGHAGKVAIRESAGTSTDYTIYTPPEGMRAYDKSQDRDYQYTGSAWQSATGRWRSQFTQYTANGTFSKHARCIQVKVIVIGGGGDVGGAGGNVSFGSHLSATGGAGAAGVPGTGTASGGLTFSGRLSSEGGFPGLAIGVSGYGQWSSGAPSGGAGGGAAIKIIPASSLATSETVTVGTRGYCLVEEFIED